MTKPGNAQAERLRPYVPRQVLHWLAETPMATFREIEGTLVFVDISGFTKLSERLAKQGKVGAEQLTDAIGACFTQLLGVAYGNGGGLVKFGGDALLLLYQGDNHAVRATQAAVGMRRALRAMGPIDCSGSRVTLRMSIGLHSGTFHFFLVGEAHRELLVTGPDATQTVLMEATAEAGEIVVSPATAAALPPAVLGPVKGAGRLLRRQPAGLAAWDPDPDLSIHALSVDGCIPAPIREQALVGHTEPAHKLVSVGFLHFDGTDALIGGSGAQAAADVLGSLVIDVQRAADRYGVCFLGSDVDKDGGKIILTAGAPTGTGDDEERLLLTLREVLDVDRPISVRAGVNAGHVFAGEIGPPYRRAYTVMGDAVNLAARVMAKATPGQLLATAGVVSRARTVFATSQLDPFMVKGKSKPVQAVAIGAARGRSQSDHGAVALVGRDRELRVLTDALTAARDGDGRFIDLLGEPGIGKSRLMSELRAHAHDLTVLTTNCEAYESSTPYFPFRQLLRAALGSPDEHDAKATAERLLTVLANGAPDLMAWAPLIAVALDIDVPSTPEVDRLSEKFRGAKLQQVVEELLDRLLDRPTLILVEDTHWMDEASAELLQRLASGVGDRPWLVCASRRDVDTGFVPASATPVETLRLDVLDDDGATLLAEAFVDAVGGEIPLAPHEVDAVVVRSGGNPLFLGQLVATVQDTGLDALPDSVEGAIVARVDGLPSPERSLLRRLSVLGSAFDRSLAEAVFGDDLPSARSSVWRRLNDFLAVDSRTIRFRQALLRDGAYETLPYRLRQQLHAQVAEAIERQAGDRSDDLAEALSVHFFHARRFDAALRYSRVAGEQARAIYANVDAADFFERALDSARACDGVPAAELSTLYEALGDVRKRIGEFARAAEAYRQARGLLTEPSSEARVLLKEGGVRKQCGRYQQARRWLRRASQTLEPLDDGEAAPLRAQVAVTYASVAMEECRYAEVVKWCHRAIALARQADDKDALAHALQLLDVGYGELGQWDRAMHFEQALALYEEIDDLWGQGTVLNNMGAHAYFRGRWQESVRLYERARQAWETVGDAVYAAIATANEGEILSDQGRLDEAEQLFRKALRVWQAAGDRSAIGYALGNLGRLAARAGRFDEARLLLGQARSEFVGVGAAGDVHEIDARLAECLVMEGNATAGLAAVTSLLGIATSGQHDALLYRLAGQAAVQLGDYIQARESLRHSFAAAAERRTEFETALTLQAMARLAELSDLDDDPAAELLARAQQIFDQLGVGWVAEPPVQVRQAIVIPEPRLASATATT
jgi:class 3 adenylate cyclase/tetratricopeptide (TPR) repeat protein